MKKLFLICALFSMFFCTNQLFSKKIALIIAIGNYPPETGWGQISSLNDVPIVKEALIKQGFQEKDITVLKDEEATYKGIKDAFSKFEKKLEPGDIVVVHFSSHGQQIEDDNDDELDGLDEAIVPYDANIKFSKNYKGQNHFRDDELGNILNGIRKKIGSNGDLLVLLDACHSGTGTRGYTKARGSKEIFSITPNFKPKTITDPRCTFLKNINTGNDLSPMVVVSGAGQNELNNEYEGKYGSLSYAFYDASQKINVNTTYQGLFDIIKIKMSSIAPRQTPQVEGYLSRAVFGGNIVKQKPYFSITEIKSKNQVKINAGKIFGVNKGSIIAFYDIDTPEPDSVKYRKIAEGVVISSSLSESTVELNKQIDVKDFKEKWAFVTEQNFGDFAIKLKIDLTTHKEFETKIKEKIQNDNLSIFEINQKDYDLLIVDYDPLIVQRGKPIKIFTKDEVLIFEKEPDPKDNLSIIDNIINKLKDCMLGFYLKNMDNTSYKKRDENLSGSFEIIPIEGEMTDNVFNKTKENTLAEKNVNGNIVFKEGDYYSVRIKNTGKEPMYYHLIEILPDYSVNCLFTDRTADELKLGAGEKIKTENIWMFVKPYGNQVTKLICTRKPLPTFCEITQKRNVDSKRGAGFSSLEKIIDACINPNAKTRSITINTNIDDISIESLVIKIEPKKE